MRRIFLLATILILFVFVWIFPFHSLAQNNPATLLKGLLDLPAPAPPNELIAINPAILKPEVVREPAFYKKNNIPPDDAPIEELLAYWSKQSSAYQDLRYNVKPSDKTTERLLEYCEDNPDTLLTIINIIPGKPKFAEIVKKIYDAEMQKDPPNYSFYTVRRWLLYRSNYFSDELLKTARTVKDDGEYVTNQDELIALSRVDWDRAEPILQRLINDPSQPVAATLAKWCYYLHALETEDDGNIDKYRKQLQETVENRNALPGARDLAMDALVNEGDWDGRDDWYISLLGDETLFELRVNGTIYTGLTTLLLNSPPEKWIPQMIKLVGNKNPAIHNAAVRNLATFFNEENVEVIRALLPWITNPKWAKEIEGARRNLILAVGKVRVPESIPALISLLASDDEYAIYAAQSLGFYQDARAVPALRMVLAKENSPENRRILIASLIQCGGLTDEDQANALVAYATLISTEKGLQEYQQYENNYYEESEEEPEEDDGAENFSNANSANVAKESLRSTTRVSNSVANLLLITSEIKPIPLMISIGSFVAQQKEPSAGLVVRVIQHEKALRKTKPEVADKLAEIMREWKGAAIFIERLQRIREGSADLEIILTAIAERKEMREKIPNEVLALRGANGIAGGLAACFAEEETAYFSVLSKPDEVAKTAMLGCARLIRAKLPVAEIGGYLNSPNKLLALAAERYLESEDSVQARTLVLAKHPNEAVILGARQAFIPVKGEEYSEPLNKLFQSVNGQYFNGFEYTFITSNEEKLRKEMKENPDLLIIYGLLPNRAEGQQVVRVFKDRVTFTNYEDEARYFERTLTGKEYQDFTRLLIAENVDSFAPFANYCYGCQATEFVMFGRNGGRRVFIQTNYFIIPPISKIFQQFNALNQGELKLNYRLASKIKNLEVLLADKKQLARVVWKNGDDLRVLVEDKEKEAEIQKNLEEQFSLENSVELDEEANDQRYQRYLSQAKRRQEVATAHYLWRRFENGKLSAPVQQPADAQFLIDETQYPNNYEFESEPRAWKVRAKNFEIRTNNDEEKNGIYKVNRSQTPIKIIGGYFSSPIVTADGNWVVVSKINFDEEELSVISRINLNNGKEFPVNLPAANTFSPVAFVASQNKVLVMRSDAPRYYRDEYEVEETSQKPKQSPKTLEYFLLDANTGATQPIKGEFRPLQDQTYRPLQTTSQPNEFWAAIYDETTKETAVGRYNTKTFTFQPTIKMPEIKLDSMNIWVNEKDAKIYFVYQGHLLAVPLISNQ